jgi:hypothetical protein
VTATVVGRKLKIYCLKNWRILDFIVSKYVDNLHSPGTSVPYHIKGTVSPAQYRLKVVWLNRLWLRHPLLYVLKFSSYISIFDIASKFLTS